MEINELREFFKDNAIEENSSINKNKQFKVEITLCSGANFKIFGSDSPMTETLFSFAIDVPYKVENYVHTEEITEEFTKYLTNKYNKGWDNDPDFMEEMFMMDAHQTYYDNNGITPEIKIINKNKDNEKYFDDFNEFIKDKIFICPALPKNIDDGSDDTTLYDEGHQAYAKLVPIEKIKDIINFNGGIKCENKINRRPKMR